MPLNKETKPNQRLFGISLSHKYTPLQTDILDFPSFIPTTAEYWSQQNHHKLTLMEVPVV